MRHPGVIVMPSTDFIQFVERIGDQLFIMIVNKEYAKQSTVLLGFLSEFDV